MPAPQARHTSDTPRETRGTVVIKVGGSVAGQTSADADIVAALHDAGTPLVVVHGGGPLVGEWSTRVGLEPRFERGLRVTDEATRDVALAVLAGLANSRLVAALVQRGVPAVGLSGIDGGLLRAERESVDLGLVGRVTLVDSSLVEELIDAGRVPVIAPAALESGTGELLNVNADSVAGAVAASIGARLLAFITDVPGVRGRDGKLIPLLDRTSAGALVEDGTIEGGMLPKVEACLLAASAGCRAAIVASGGDGLERLLGGGTAGTVFEIAE
ncbi:MAG: acetylglutamate kinase [Chloroflexota bacterium]|nr:acetylglutamate kinase [Chloroflexota bacterium]